MKIQQSIENRRVYDAPCVKLRSLDCSGRICTYSNEVSVEPVDDLPDFEW